MAHQQRDSIKEQFWRNALRRRERRGTTVREFCRREGLKESTYHFWRRELIRRDALSPASHRALLVRPDRILGNRHASSGVPLTPSKAAATRRTSGMRSPRRTCCFAPVTVSAIDGAGAVAEIVLRDARVVRVARGCDRETLGMVLSILQERPC